MLKVGNGPGSCGGGFLKAAQLSREEEIRGTGVARAMLSLISGGKKKSVRNLGGPVKPPMRTKGGEKGTEALLVSKMQNRQPGGTSWSTGEIDFCSARKENENERQPRGQSLKRLRSTEGQPRISRWENAGGIPD